MVPLNLSGAFFFAINDIAYFYGMFDFRLKVFHTVAKRLNFTKAAHELYITQPAVTKHIKEIEQQLKVKLFDRNGTKIKLTASGEKLFSYSEKIFELYRQLETDIHLTDNRFAGTLRIGASTTIANYILPLVFPSFRKRYPDIRPELSMGNTEQIEKLLMNKEIDLGITEGYSKSAFLKYTVFLKDEIVLVAAATNPLHQAGRLSLSDLKSKPLIIREPGSGTLEVISHALEQAGVKMKDLSIIMQLGSSESIKLYLLNSDGLAFLSVYTMLNELEQHRFAVIEMEELAIERYFYFVQPQGQANPLVDLFVNFTSSYNFR